MHDLSRQESPDTKACRHEHRGLPCAKHLQKCALLVLRLETPNKRARQSKWHLGSLAAALSMRSVAWCILKVSSCSSNRIVGPRGTRLSVNGNLTREYRTDCETIGNRKTAAATEVPGDQARNQGKGKNGALQHPYDKDGNPTLDESWCYNRNSENCLIAWKFLMAQLLREP